MDKLKLCHPPSHAVTAGGRAIEANPLRPQVIYTQQLLRQGTFKGLSAFVITQRLQDPCQVVVAEVKGVDTLPDAAAQSVELLCRPRLDVAQSMIGPGEDMDLPEHGDPPQSEPTQLPWLGKCWFQQGLHPHPLQLGQQQGNVIDTVANDVQGPGHAEILP